MPKRLKGCPLGEAKRRLTARDSNAQRIIFGIGSEWIAINFFSQVTKLPPDTGDQPAVVLPINQSTKKKPKKTVGYEIRESAEPDRSRRAESDTQQDLKRGPSFGIHRVGALPVLALEGTDAETHLFP